MKNCGVCQEEKGVCLRRTIGENRRRPAPIGVFLVVSRSLASVRSDDLWHKHYYRLLPLFPVTLQVSTMLADKQYWQNIYLVVSIPKCQNLILHAVGLNIVKNRC